MRIEHIALYVNDLEAAREFYCRYLAGRAESATTTLKRGFNPISCGLRAGHGWN